VNPQAVGILWRKSQHGTSLMHRHAQMPGLCCPDPERCAIKGQAQKCFALKAVRCSLLRLRLFPLSPATTEQAEGA
jgi:hypothetical protein